MDAILLHCLDHVASGAQVIKKHNEALKADPTTETPRDQGFTRPKVSHNCPYTVFWYAIEIATCKPPFIVILTCLQCPGLYLDKPRNPGACRTFL